MFEITDRVKISYFKLSRENIFKERTPSLSNINALFVNSQSTPGKLEEIGKVKQGEKVLVVGGSSGIGVFAIQIAKALGAHVTATATAMKVSILSFVGADISVDSSAIDITKGKLLIAPLIWLGYLRD